MLQKRRPDSCCNSHEEASGGETVDHYSMLCFSGLSLVHGWQRQVCSGVESVSWVWHGIYKFLHFHNASFGEVTDGFSFILNEFRELMAESSLSSVLDL
jgi:hypothetical protein